MDHVLKQNAYLPRTRYSSGPLPSGLLSECVLRHFDDNSLPSGKFRYFRYVDDIRLFARSKKELRGRLVVLDRLSKEVGLFPQSSKIDIHRVKRIEDEIKTLSHPLESVALPPQPNQVRVRNRLRELSPRFLVPNETRFKFVLGSAVPNSQLSIRLLTILESAPHLYPAVCAYFSKATRLSRRTSEKCLQVLKTVDLYSSFTAALIRALRGRIHLTRQLSFERYCRSKLSPSPSRHEDPELRAAAASVLLLRGAMTLSQTRHNVFWNKDWWVRTESIRYVQRNVVGDLAYESMLNKLLRDKCADVSLIAAEITIAEGVVVRKPTGDIHKIGQVVLKASGLISRIGPGVCPVSESMVDVLGSRVSLINWRIFLGRKYKAVVRKIVRWRGYVKTDPTAWVNLTDTINDFILSSLFDHDSSIGSYNLGSIGSVLNPPTNRFAVRYPRLFEAVKEVHERRLETYLSHPITRSTGRFTRSIGWEELPRLRTRLREGYLEMWRLVGIN